jgi:hypothetical protein
MPDKVRVFVSHSHRDNEFTARLVADLEAADADVWVDSQDIAYDDFVKKINEGLSGRQWLVLVMTPDALKSLWVHTEVNAAMTLVHKRLMRGVIPFVAKLCSEAEIPPLRGPLHRYDATTGYETALSGLLRAIGLRDKQATIAQHPSSASLYGAVARQPQGPTLLPPTIPPKLHVWPLRLDLGIVPAGEDSRVVELEVSNRGGGNLTGRAELSTPNLIVDPMFVDSTTTHLRVLAFTKDMSLGAYAFHLTIRTNGGIQTVPIRLTVTDGDEMQAKGKPRR